MRKQPEPETPLVTEKLGLSLEEVAEYDYKTFACKVVAPLINRGPLDYPHLDQFYENIPTLYRGLFLDPRGHLKSTVGVVAYAAWRLNRNPSLRFLIPSAKAEMARADLYAIKMILEALGKRPEKLDGRSKWAESMIRLKRDYLSKEPSVMAAGVDTGTVSFHFDHILCDDLHDQDNIGKKSRATVRRFWNQALMGIIDPKTQLLVFATRWHHDDIYSDLMRLGWPVFRRAVWVQDETVSCPVILKDSGAVCGSHHKPLFPEKYTAEYVHYELMDRMTQSSFVLQYLNDPTLARANVFNPEWLIHYNPESVGWDVQNMRWRTVQAVDLMTSENTERSDYFVSLILTVNAIGEYYIRDIMRGKWDLDEKIKKIQDHASRFSPWKVAIDATANQVILAQLLKKTTTLPIEEIRGREYKYLRIEALAPLFKQKRIRVNKNAEWFKDFELEYLEYAGEESETDDQLDALAMAFATMGKTVTPAFLSPKPAYSRKLDELDMLQTVRRGRRW